jgi:hypothetical protein
MKKGSAWLAIIAGYVVMASGLIILTFIPETLAKREPASEDDPQPDDTIQHKLRQSFKQVKTEIRATWDIMKHPSLFLILLIFTTMGPQSLAASQFLVQYISKRFHWSIADAGFLLSLQGIINIALFFVILPAFSTSLQSVFGLSAGGKDKLLAFLSSMFIFLGSLLLAGDRITVVITGLIVFTFGAGLPPVCRSLAAYYVDSQNASKLQTLISVMETAGILYAGQFLSSLFALGIRLGGLWTGLPYIGVASITAITVLAVILVRLPDV